MHYLVGLGNPGQKYEGTRHNVGWFMVREFIKKSGLPGLVDSRAYVGAISEGVLAGTEVMCLLPMTFMNQSGSAVAKLVPKEAVGNLIVVYDDVDLPVGELKISIGKGAGGHNGVQSIINSLASKDFIRIRVGIAPKAFWTGKARRPAAAVLPGFVLKQFTAREQHAIDATVPTLVAAIETILTDGVARAMNEYNQ